MVPIATTLWFGLQLWRGIEGQRRFEESLHENRKLQDLTSRHTRALKALSKPQISDVPIQHLLWAHSMHTILGKEALELPAYANYSMAFSHMEALKELAIRDAALEQEVDELHARGEL